MKTYSSGMGSRLRFAIAAARSQDILLVDEALATGDAEFRVKSHKRIEDLRAAAGTVFLVAHNLEEVELTCNRVIWMERGQIVKQGEDVIGIIDEYIAASGGAPIMRDPVTRARVKAQTMQPGGGLTSGTPVRQGTRISAGLLVVAADKPVSLPLTASSRAWAEAASYWPGR